MIVVTGSACHVRRDRAARAAIRPAAAGPCPRRSCLFDPSFARSFTRMGRVTVSFASATFAAATGPPNKPKCLMARCHRCRAAVATPQPAPGSCPGGSRAIENKSAIASTASPPEPDGVLTTPMACSVTDICLLGY